MDELSMQYFDKVSPRWDEMRESFFPDSVRETAIKKADIKPGEIIADIGAGSGFITESLIGLNISIIAIDQSDGMLLTMKNKFVNIPNIEYVKTDSDRIPLGNNSIDAALANMFLHHVEDPGFVINEIFRILKPGGRLVITDLDSHDHTFLAVEQHDRWLGFDRQLIGKWFHASGFRNINVECLGDNCISHSTHGNEFADISIFIANGLK